jgi:hypothetical protein
VCLVALAVCAWGQNPTISQSRVPVQIDPTTGQFRLLQPDVEVLPLATPITGKFVVNFKITVASTLPATDVISCGVSSTLLDVGSTFEIFETATVAATRSGSTATCTVTLPYSWTLLTSTTDMVLLSYEILAPATTVGSPLPNRSSNHGFANIHVPASGATTTFNLTPTI